MTKGNPSKMLEIDGKSSTNGKDVGQDKGLIGRVRKAFLYSFISCLAVSALMAIICVLAGKFGKFEGKVLVTTTVVTVASICLLCCIAYLGRKWKPMPGVAGIILIGVSAVMLIGGVWTEVHSHDYWEITAVICVFAIASAHLLALLAVRLKPGHVWLQIAAAVNILLLALVISGMIVVDFDDGAIWKLVAVLAILAALETLLIPILGRLARVQPVQSRETLTLTKREDGTYEDGNGRVYTVSEVSPSVEAASNKGPQ